MLFPNRRTDDESTTMHTTATATTATIEDGTKEEDEAHDEAYNDEDDEDDAGTLNAFDDDDNDNDQTGLIVEDGNAIELSAKGGNGTKNKKRAKGKTSAAKRPVDDDDRAVALHEESLREKKSYIPAASFNMTNSIIGVGLIGMPFALKEAGFFAGIFLLALVALITDYSVMLLITSCKLVSKSSYQDLMLVSFGKTGWFVLSVIQFSFPFAAMCSYSIIVGDTGRSVAMVINPDSVFANRQLIVVLGVFIVALPLCLIRNISHFSKVSIVSIMSVGYLVLSVVIQGVRLDLPKSEDAFDIIHPNFVQSIGIMAHAFVCHHNVLLIYSSLHIPTLDRFGSVTHVSVVVSLAIALTLAIGGYLSFTDQTKANILKNFDDSDMVILVARVSFAVSTLLTYPIECFVARQVIDETFFRHRPRSTLRHFLITLGIVVCSCAIAVATDNLGAVLELNGVICAASLAFIFPGMCYVKNAGGSLFTPRKLLAIALLLFGFGVQIVGTILIIFGLATEG